MSQSETDLPGLLINDPPGRSRCTLVLAHGAGAPMDTPFMETIAAGVAAGGVRVVRFEFPYMAQRRIDGKRRPPNRAPLLQATWKSVIASQKAPVFIGGKSMGGRIASMVACDVAVEGVICLGYPFHPAGKPERLRIEHLQSMTVPTLIVQGQRDPMGNAAEVAGYDLSDRVQLHWLTDGDHSFKPRKSSGVPLEENLAEAVQVVTRFIDSVTTDTAG